jgi:hypothetical protein
LTVAVAQLTLHTAARRGRGRSAATAAEKNFYYRPGISVTEIHDHGSLLSARRRSARQRDDAANAEIDKVARKDGETSRRRNSSRPSRPARHWNSSLVSRCADLMLALGRRVSETLGRVLDGRSPGMPTRQVLPARAFSDPLGMKGHHLLRRPRRQWPKVGERCMRATAPYGLTHRSEMPNATLMSAECVLPRIGRCHTALGRGCTTSHSGSCSLAAARSRTGIKRLLRRKTRGDDGRSASRARHVPGRSSGEGYGLSVRVVTITQRAAPCCPTAHSAWDRRAGHALLRRSEGRE